MAIGVNSLTSGTSTTDASSYATASVTPGANRLVVLTVTSTMSSTTVPNQPTVTGNGLTWVAVGTAVFPSGSNRIRQTVFRTMGASPSAGTVTISFGGQTQLDAAWSLVEYTGTDTTGTNGSGAVVQTATNTGTGVAASLTIAAYSNANNRLHIGNAHQFNETASPANSLLELHDLQLNEASTPDLGQETCWGYIDRANGSFTAAGWSTASNWVAVAFEIKCAISATVSTVYPTLTLELSTAAPGSTPAWQDISQYFVSGTIHRGRQFELDRIEAGTAEFTVLNTDRRFDPTFTTGPYYGSLLPLRRMRLTAEWQGVIYPLFHGFIEAFDQIWPAKGAPVAFATFRCVDAFEIMARRFLTPSQAVLTTSLGVVGGDLKFTARGGTGPAWTPPFGYGWAPNPYPSPGGYGSQITIAYDASKSDFPPPPQVDVSTGTRAIVVQLHTVGSTPDSLAKNILQAVNSHVIAGQWVKAELAPGSTGYGKPPAMAATPLAGGFPVEKSDVRINRILDQISWPAGDRFVQTGSEWIMATQFEAADHMAALQHAQDVAATELGVFYIDGSCRAVFLNRTHRSNSPYSTSAATFSDNPGVGEYPYVDLDPVYDSRFIYNNVTVQRQGGTAQTVSDSTSITKFLQRDLSITVICDQDGGASIIASTLLNKYRNLSMRYDSITVRPQAGSDIWQYMLGLDISRRITVKRTPPGGGEQWSQQCHIEAIDLSFDRHMQNTELRWQLSPA